MKREIQILRPPLIHDGCVLVERDDREGTITVVLDDENNEEVRLLMPELVAQHLQRKLEAAIRTCDTCGDAVGDYFQAALDADICSTQCLDRAFARRGVRRW